MLQVGLNRTKNPPQLTTTAFLTAARRRNNTIIFLPARQGKYTQADKESQRTTSHDFLRS
jgi:hypothetical protein